MATKLHLTNAPSALTDMNALKQNLVRLGRTDRQQRKELAASVRKASHIKPQLHAGNDDISDLRRKQLAVIGLALIVIAIAYASNHFKQPAPVAAPQVDLLPLTQLDFSHDTLSSHLVAPPWVNRS